MPEEKIERLSMVCPVDVTAQSFDGQPVAVDFELPMTTGGQEPVAVDCSPVPGHIFDLGATEVSCRSSDALQQTAGCTFGLTVLGPPKLSVTHFVAFGDSLTAGWVSPPAGGARPEPSSAYTYLLERDLQSRYVTQTIEVINAGAPGEQAREAILRFRSVVRSERPEVVLLMEGTNDLDPVGGGGVESAAEALDAMVRYAQGTGADVLLMTVPPSLRIGVSEGVPALNSAIKSIASRRGAVLIDIHDVLLHGACSGGRRVPCIGGDRLHPTAEGYRLVAEEVGRVVVDEYDVEILPVGAGRTAWHQSSSAVGAPVDPLTGGE